MRMWMINPKVMCRQHLLGEHVELHMLVGCLKKEKSIKGYIERDLLEPQSIRRRHQELVKEMERRGYKHRSKLPSYERFIMDWNKKDLYHKINRANSIKQLADRCVECKRKMYY